MVTKTDSPAKKIDYAEAAKQVFLALMTGGLTLLWLIAKRLPAYWERTWELRNQWIANGRDPRDWSWIIRGWLTVFATTIVILPLALALSSLTSYFFRQHSGFAVHHVTFGILLIAAIFFLTMCTMLGLFCTYTFHTVRMMWLSMVHSIHTRFSTWSL